MAMTEFFIIETWDAWKDPLIRMLICPELRPLDPCRDSLFTIPLRTMMQGNLPDGWGTLFGKQSLSASLHGWESRFLDSIEVSVARNEISSFQGMALTAS